LSSLDQRDEPGSRGARRGTEEEPIADRQTLLVRRTVAIGVIVVLLIGLIFLVRGCLEARTERALTDYTRDVSVLVQESNRQSEQFFGLLREPGGQSPVGLQNTVNGIRVRADRLVDRADGVETPDDLEASHAYLRETLAFRRDGLTGIARRLPAALGDEGRADANEQIAAQMQSFTASDVIYARRFLPGVRGELRERELLGEVRPPASAFLDDVDWLQPRFVAQRITAIRAGGDGGEGAAPGLHGTGLGTVTVQPSGLTLTEGQAVEIPVSEDLAFAVQVQNQGQSTEQDVTVEVSIAGTGSPVRVQEQIDTIDAGQTQTVTIPVADPPPTGRPVTIEVKIARVRGEQTVDNNRASFRAVFTA
jgi:hypothetical protein